MFLLTFLAIVAIVGLAAYLVYAYGADSRIDEVARRRGFQR